MFLGTIAACLTALSMSIHAFTLKQASIEHTSVLSFTKAFAALTIICLLIILTPWGAWTPPSPELWSAIVLTILLESVITFAFTRAHQRGDQSLAGPLFATSVILLLPLGTLFLNEQYTPYDIVGVLLVFIGSLLMGWSKDNHGLLKATKAIWGDRGTPWMLFDALLAALVLTIAKFSFNAGVPVLTFALYVLLGQSILLLPLAVKTAIAKKHTFTSLKNVSAVSVSFGVLQLFHYVGLSLLPAAYFISIKRLSIVTDVLVGRYVGKETVWFFSRLRGALLMFAGVLLFLLFGS